MRSRKTQPILLWVFALLLVALLAGCGGSTAPTQSDEAPDQEAAEETSEDAPTDLGIDFEAEPEAEELDPAEIVGMWVLEESAGNSLNEMLSLGLFQTYDFAEDGSLTVTLHILNYTIERKGTYRIDGQILLISLPEMNDEYMNRDGSTSAITASAIEDGEVVFDGDKLTTTVISGSGSESVLRRIDNGEYQQFVEQIAALAPNVLAVGETFTNDSSTITIDSFEYVQEIYPSDTSGYYTYCVDEPGNSYLLVRVTYTNNGTEWGTPGLASGAWFTIGENKYVASIEVDNYDSFESNISLEAKETSPVYVYCSVPDSVIGTDEVLLHWAVPKDPEDMQYYFDSSTPYDMVVVTLE